MVKGLDAYAHTVAHDLRNPVVGIKGISETLRDYWDSMENAQKREFVDMVYQSANSLENVIRELLLLSSVRKQSIKTGPVDISKSMAEVANRLRVMLQEKHAVLKVDPDPISIYGYGPWITEVLANFTSNAIKYGGSPREIHVGTEKLPDGSVMTYVDDNGTGVPEDRRAALFQEFTRNHGEGSPGHGLGLSIVLRIISKLEGNLGVADSPMGGARFFFSLPEAKNNPD